MTDMTPIDSLKPQRRNANKHSQRGMGQLEKSVQTDGWIGAITVAADGETFDGSARIEVAAATGFQDAIVVRSDGTRPIVHIREDIPTADDPRAVRLGVAANRTAEVNLEWDTTVLAEIGQDVDLSGLFFPHEIAAMLEQAGTDVLDAAELWKGMPEFEQDDKTAWKSITVHFANESDYEAFARLTGQTLTPQTKSIWHPYRPNDSYIVNECADES